MLLGCTGANGDGSRMIRRRGPQAGAPSGLNDTERWCIVDTSALLSPELLAKLEKFELVSRKIFRGRVKGERRSPRKGQSVEFADFRNYVPGDDLRFVDWNTTRGWKNSF